jgi:hypothetical protein
VWGGQIARCCVLRVASHGTDGALPTRSDHRISSKQLTQGAEECGGQVGHARQQGARRVQHPRDARAAAEDALRVQLDEPVDQGGCAALPGDPQHSQPETLVAVALHRKVSIGEQALLDGSVSGALSCYHYEQHHTYSCTAAQPRTHSTHL